MSSYCGYLEELFFFFLKSNLEKLNVLNLFTYNVPDIFVTSDARSTSLAAFFVHQNKEFICHKNLSIAEKKELSTYHSKLLVFSYAFNA